MLQDIIEQWNELSEDYKKLEEVNDTYLVKLKELKAKQAECLKHIAHQRYRIGIITKHIQDLEENEKNSNDIKRLQDEFLKREAELQIIELALPKPRETYLSVVLGSVDVSFLTKEDKFKYKDEYEKFKLVSHVIVFVMASLILTYRIKIIEALYLFFLVWYYCTTTIRESILKANGTKIKGWWRVHHILSTVTSGILLIFPESEIWDQFRSQFLRYNIYSCFVQYLQFKYQRGALYRLKALGERDNMDITIEGFHSWMWRGLTFLLPFLFVTYLYQLYHSITLFNLRNHPDATWHVHVLCILFLIFFLGNTITTLMVIPDKIRHKMKLQYRVMAQRLTSVVKNN